MSTEKDPSGGAEKKDYMDRINIESLNTACVYSLELAKTPDQECPLCRSNLLAPSPEDLQKGNLKVLVILGACSHYFHKTCIEGYAKDNDSCPVDKTPWKMKSLIPIQILFQK